MTRADRVGFLALIAALVGLGACTGDGGQGPHLQTSPMGPDGVGPRILVDASRDGGVWWFPQVAPFSDTDRHQGQYLADSLRSLGYVVKELPRPFAITAALLDSFDIVIRAHAFGTYGPTEVSAYRRYVEQGGRLLLLSDHMKYAPPDGVALGFGIDFRGVTLGENLLDNFGAHAITSYLEPLRYNVGSGIVAYPKSAQIVGRLSSGSYLDLDKDGAQGPTEPSAPAVLGVMTYGKGRIVFCGDVGMWEWIPQPLVSNVLAWLEE